MNKPAPHDSLLLTYFDAARLLCLSVPTLERMVRAETIPFVRIGKSVRFRRATLELWLAAHEKGGGPNE